MAGSASLSLRWLLRTLDERRALRHGLFWLLVTGLVMLLFLYDMRMTTRVGVALGDALLVLVPNALATYALLFGVLPWLGRGGWGRFGLALAAWGPLSMGLLFAWRGLVFVPLHAGVPSPFPDYHIAVSIGPYLLLLSTAGVAAGLHLHGQWRRQQLANARLARENAQAELHLLQAQLHPHFLFNTLNNLYALTLRQSAQAPEVVERLTGLLHFVVAQGSAPLVTLADEVALLRNYLALEQLRYGPRLSLAFEAEGLPPAGRLAPLLLLPLVENAFKHGPAAQLGRARVCIRLALADGLFSCVIENSRGPAPAAGGAAGIGLRNVRQRLHLLYPQRHHLAVEERADSFTVRLSLPVPVGAEAASLASAP